MRYNGGKGALSGLLPLLKMASVSYYLLFLMLLCQKKINKGINWKKRRRKKKTRSFCSLYLLRDIDLRSFKILVTRKDDKKSGEHVDTAL